MPKNRYWRDVVENAPAEWERLKLKEVFRERKERRREDLPLLSVTGDRGVIPRDELDRRDTSSSDKSKYLRVAPGDLAYNTMRMWQGVSGVSSYEGIVSPAYTVCELKDSHNPQFMGYLSKLPLLIGRFHAYSQGIVSDTLSLRFQQFGEIIAPTPPPEEQRRIAAILSSVDDAIAATRKVIEQTKRVKQGLLQTLMTRGTGHTRFKKTQIGEIPEEWELTEADDLCHRISVGIVVRPASLYVDEGVPCIRSANISRDGIIDKDWVFISEASSQDHAKSILKSGDVVVVRTGDPGTACVVPDWLDGCNCVDIIFARPRLNRVNSDYLSWFLNSSAGRRQVVQRRGGLAQKHLNVGALKQMYVPVPSLEEQSHIVERIATIQKTEKVSVRQLTNLGSLKRGLMQDLLTGRVRAPLD